MRIWTKAEDWNGRRVILPASAHDENLLRGVRLGVPMSATLKFGRSGKRERWYWAFIEYVAEGIGMDKYSLHARVRYAMDRIQAIVEGAHGPVVLLQSTARDAMDDVRHAEYVTQAVEVVFRLYLPEVRRKDVLREVERMVGYGQPL